MGYLGAFGLMCTLFLLAACVQDVVCPDGSVVKNAAACAPEEMIAPPQELSPAIQDLQTKAAKIKSYKFLYAPLPENKGAWTYEVKGSFARIDVPFPAVGVLLDTVFLDFKYKRAVAYCFDKKSCDNTTQIVTKPSYDTYAIALPHELIRDLSAAVETGAIQYEDRTTKILEWQVGAEYHRMLVDSFYGFPLKHEIFANADHTGVAQGASYRDLAYNVVADERVVPPAGWS